MQVAAADQRATEQTPHQRLTDHRARRANGEHSRRDEMRDRAYRLRCLSLSMSNTVASAGGNASCDDDSGDDDSETLLVGEAMYLDTAAATWPWS